MTESVETQNTVSSDDADGWEWAIVEVFGHRKHAGRVREEERFGTKMLRIDVPTVDAATGAALEWTTRWYGGPSLFSVTPTDEASVMRVNRPYAPPRPVSLPAPAPADDGGDCDPNDDEF